MKKDLNSECTVVVEPEPAPGIGRDIVFSACQWGTDSVHEWIRTSGAHLFRSTIDINDCWESIKEIEEYQTHFSLWAMMNSPLMIGCDIRKFTDETKKILLNQDLIAINQDIECRPPFQLNCESNSPDTFTLVKFLSVGDIAIGMFNMGDVPAVITIDFWDIGLSASAGRSLEFFDCIEHKHLGKKEEMFYDTVPTHGSKVYRCRVVEK